MLLYICTAHMNNCDEVNSVTPLYWFHNWFTPQVLFNHILKKGEDLVARSGDKKFNHARSDTANKLSIMEHVSRKLGYKELENIQKEGRGAYVSWHATMLFENSPMCVSVVSTVENAKKGILVFVSEYNIESLLKQTKCKVISNKKAEFVLDGEKHKTRETI